MSYCAEGYGELHLITEESISEDMLKQARKFCDDIGYVSDRMVLVEYHWNPYDDTKVNELCKLVASCIHDGSIKFRGEDDMRWRFKYNRKKKKFEEQDAVDVYEGEKTLDDIYCRIGDALGDYGLTHDGEQLNEKIKSVFVDLKEIMD